MRRVNLKDPETKPDPEDPPGYRAEMYRFGKDLGARQTGASLYVIAPGEGGSPYHYEHGEEEWLLVLGGRPSLPTPGGTGQPGPLGRRLFPTRPEGAPQPVALVCFPSAPEGAREIRNDSGAPVRILMWSTVVVPTPTTYPDSDK